MLGDSRGALGEAREPPGETRDAWHIAGAGSFIFYVEQLREPLARHMKAAAPGYRWAHSNAVSACYWANHCEHCDVLIEDHDLFCEPDGAFLPTGEAGAARIELTAYDEPIEATVGGYSEESQFLHAMKLG